MLDLGLPLTATSAEQNALPQIAGLSGGDSSLLGVVVSHPHPDHYGLVPQIDPSVPLFVGEAAESILNEAAFFTGAARLPTASGYLRHHTAFQQGPFRITPYLVDHSAFDSYALLVEAGRRRLFYSGDLRSHGRKPGTFELLIKKPPSGIHAFLLEGTRVGQSRPGQLSSEQDVEQACRQTFEGTEGVALALFSPQNVDRLVSVYKAARRADRQLVLDLYAACVARATAHATIPQVGFEGVRVYVPQRQRILVKESREFDRINSLGPSRIMADEIAADPSRYVLIFRHSMSHELAGTGMLEGASATWMMWPGYLEMDRSLALQRWLHDQGIEMNVVHTSGHATLADLKRVAEAVNARRVVPIHTSAPELFDEHFLRVQRQRDGEWWEV